MCSLHFDYSAFLFSERMRAMLIRYRRNKKTACYDSDNLVTHGKVKAEPRLHGPFPSCGDCPYPSHGFICYSSEGNCMRTYMQKMNQRRNTKE